MTPYQSSWSIHYSVSSLQQQAEVAVITAAGDIQNEGPETPDDTNRKSWANWASKNSKEATVAFMWPIAMNPSIQANIQTDPSGASVPDSDVQFVVNSILPAVIADFIANPPAAPAK